MKKFLILVFTFLIVFPLGIISKLFYWVHSTINQLLIFYKNSIDKNQVKKWTTIFNVESKEGTWEIINGKLDIVNKDVEIIKDGIDFLYFKDNEIDPTFNIKLTAIEFQELLDFATHLNKNITK